MGTSPLPGKPVSRPRRGDIYWLEMPEEHTVGSEQYGCRPWLVVSLNDINDKFPIVLAVPLTSHTEKATGTRQFRILIPDKHKIQDPGHSRGCHGDSLALTEQTRVLSTDRLPDQRAAYLTTTAMDAVEAGLAFVFDIGL
jgi:mRNA-degrading endonuclease toxin of MazEF toxin-antitoxin module